MTSHALGSEPAIGHDIIGATPGHERLSVFVGTWHTVSEIRGEEPDGRTA